MISKLTINTIDTADGPLSIDCILSSAILGLDDSFAREAGGIEVSLVAERDDEGGLVIRGKIFACPEVHCGKCAKWVPYPIEIEEFAAFYEKPLLTVIDLTPQIREDIILQLPMVAGCAFQDKDSDSPSQRCDVPTTGASPTLRGNEVWSALDDINLKE